jgi:flagellar L-ring protein precursor FlgH
MNKVKMFSMGLMLIILSFSQISSADSIWAKRDKNLRALYADDVARKIGDVLTIKITENSTVDNKAKRDLKKDVNKSITFNGKLGGFTDLGEFGTSIKSGNELKSKADYKDERKFTDRITVVVVDIQPNGNLVVMGTRSRDIGGDTQTIEVSGVVRPSDIAFDNTVRSEQVADFRIVSGNAGISEPYKKPGCLGKLLDIVWPF